MSRDRSERGQSLVLVTLLLIALIGMLALVLDGGNAYFKRRAAQNAADAGALAGAAELCLTGSVPDAIALAESYAIDHNGADVANVEVTLGTVAVDTEINFPTMFGGIFGKPTLTAAAYAAAGCFLPGSAHGVLPIAWACKPPVEGFPSDSEDCAIKYGPDQLYVIMDNSKTSEDLYCEEPPTPDPGDNAGKLDCDYDDDGVNDVLAGGDRSWLDLDGNGGGANDLKEWITEGYGVTINIHTWLPSQPGSVGSAFLAFEEGVLGTDRLVPVFDAYCQGFPSDVCPTYVHTKAGGDEYEDQFAPVGGTTALYFHVINFAIFHPTCVWAGNGQVYAADETGNISSVSSCPGRDASGLFVDPGTKSIKTVEGYFKEGTMWDLGGKGTGGDVGTFTVFLTH